MKLKINESGVKHFHYGNSPESKRKEIADRFGKTFTPDDHILTCKDGKSLNIQIGKKYKCTAFDGQRVEVVDIEDMFDDGSAMLDVAHRNNRYTVSSTQIYESKLHEQDVEIEVKHEGVLEVPEGKNVDDLPLSHFEKLAKKKGLGKITKALNNLQVWNKNDDPKLSKWAGDMIDKLNKKLKKDESIKEYYIGSEYGEYFDEHSLRQRYNTMMMLDKLDDIINLYHDLGGDFDEFAIEATERGFSKIDIFTVGLCVEGIPVKEIEKRLRMLHLMDESISRKRFNEGWHNGDATISFTHNDDLEADLEEFLFDLFSDNPDVFEFDWSGKNTILYLACDEDDYKYIKWFIEDWKYKHRDEYDEYDEYDESLKRREW